MSSTLCAIVKNEAPYLIEWALYHRSIGFDRIVIYENDSDDATPEVLEQLRQARWIDEWRPWRNIAKSPQFAAYADATRHCPTDWLIFLDADEFINFYNRLTVNEFLARFGPEIGSISINWRIFGSSGLQNYAPGLVIERFRHAGPQANPVHGHVKSFARPSYVRSVHMHAPHLSQGEARLADGGPLVMPSIHGVSDRVDWSVAKIHHYFNKSREEFLVKRRRGIARLENGDPAKFSKYTDEMFAVHDLNDEIDDSLLWAAPELRRLAGL